VPKGKENFISAGALYNALGYKEPSEVLALGLDGLKHEGAYNVRVIKLESTALCNIAALRQETNYTDKSGKPMTQELVAALRFYGEPPGILYTVELRTTRETFDRNAKVFEQVLRSFKCSPPEG